MQDRKYLREMKEKGTRANHTGWLINSKNQVHKSLT